MSRWCPTSELGRLYCGAWPAVIGIPVCFISLEHGATWQLGVSAICTAQCRRTWGWRVQRHALRKESFHQVPSFQVTSELCSLPFLGLYLECWLWNPLFGGPSRRLLLSKCFLPRPHVQILTDLFHMLIISFLYYSLHLQAFFLFFPCYFLMTISVEFWEGG